jgi:hypothetical protein
MSSQSSAGDPFLAIGLAILMFLMLIINIYTLVYWQHPDDKNESILAKLLIVFGLQLTTVTVLLIPIGTLFDVLLAMLIIIVIS